MEEFLIPRSPKARDLGHPDLWVGTCPTRLFSWPEQGLVVYMVGSR